MATTIEEGAAPDQPATPPATTGRPVIDRRIASLDIVRGFAVLGVLAANVVGFARTGPYYYWGVLYPHGFWEEAGWLVQYLLLDGKLRGLFAFLFGAGMAIFVERAAAKRGMAGALLLQGRRLLWLALFGAAHYYLLFFGDILLDYAIIGLVAMLFLPLGTRALMFFGLFASFYMGIMAAIALFPAGEIAALEAPPASAARQDYDAQVGAIVEQSRASDAVRQSGSFADLIRWRHETRTVWDRIAFLPVTGPGYLGLMLLGAALYRMGFFSGEWSRRGMIGWGLGGIAASIVLTLPLAIVAMNYDHYPAVSYWVQFGPTSLLRLPMILGYAALLVAFTPALARSGFGQRLAAAGRMAFSNYIASSVMMGIVFLGWGFGLYGDWHRLSLWAWSAGGMALMLLWSRPWLDRFRFGPLEWAWRCLTYMRLFPIRRVDPAASSFASHGSPAKPGG